MRHSPVPGSGIHGELHGWRIFTTHPSASARGRELHWLSILPCCDKSLRSCPRRGTCSECFQSALIQLRSQLFPLGKTTSQLQLLPGTPSWKAISGTGTIKPGLFPGTELSPEQRVLCSRLALGVSASKGVKIKRVWNAQLCFPAGKLRQGQLHSLLCLSRTLPVTPCTQFVNWKLPAGVLSVF